MAQQRRTRFDVHCLSDYKLFEWSSALLNRLRLSLRTNLSGGLSCSLRALSEHATGCCAACKPRPATHVQPPSRRTSARTCGAGQFGGDRWKPDAAAEPASAEKEAKEETKRAAQGRALTHRTNGHPLSYQPFSGRCFFSVIDQANVQKCWKTTCL